MGPLVCAITVLVGFNGPMTQIETQSLKRAHRGCAQYFPEAPCLTKFEKRADLTYWATCGAPKPASQVYPEAFKINKIMLAKKNK